MKPSTLKAGMRVLLQPTLGKSTELLSATVISRMPTAYGRKGQTVINVDVFVGLSNADDPGTVHLTDYEVSRFLHPMETH
ncbi:hypothetical protein L2164_01210 [Pectobacterium brasiliense]|uniref:hypothetical protein n=1 Tax=Pectobacterium brasiliense TaxID=180957 RepID=UPI0006995842|nr:hypothetical protein [Pectobacterium brasiliense]MCG5047314.1 hypothetical protein [Pectobacterium brasiliense]